MEDVIFSKSLSLPWGFFNSHIIVFFETSVLKEVRILRYLHKNSAMLIVMLILSSKIKLWYTILIHTWKTFVADFCYDNFFYGVRTIAIEEDCPQFSFRVRFRIGLGSVFLGDSWPRNVFYTLYFLTVLHFSFKWVFFEKYKTSLKTCF